MNNLVDSLFKYGLHDASISKISIDVFLLSFEFDKGVYLLDSTKKEMLKTNKTILKVYVEKFGNESLFQHMICRVIKHKKIKEISVDKFISKINGLYNNINNVYFSEFNNTIFLSGYFDNYEYELLVENVERIEYDEERQF